MGYPLNRAFGGHYSPPGAENRALSGHYSPPGAENRSLGGHYSPPGEENRALGGHYGPPGVEKKLVPPPLQELQFLGSLDHNLITISTELISFTHIV
jgi:hypothetical protein